MGTEAKRDQEWLSKVKQKVDQTISSIRKPLQDRDTRERIAHLQKIIVNCNYRCPLAQASVSYLKGSVYFNQAVKELERLELTTSDDLLRQCKQALGEAYKDGLENEVLIEDIQELVERCSFHHNRTWALIKLQKADRMLSKQINEQEEIDMDEMWAIADLYKEASLAIREHDIEIEAELASKQGQMFHKIFKENDKAKHYYDTSIKLGLSLHPKDPSCLEWYKVATKELKALQMESARYHDAAYQQVREAYLQRLQQPLAAIQEHRAKPLVEFLQYLYKTHPPSTVNPSFDLKTTVLTKQQEKRALILAIKDYHPDKNLSLLEDEATKQAFVLAEEITRILNQLYSATKGF